MKKLIQLILACALCFSLTACGNRAEEQILPGTLEGNTFSMPEAGFSLTLPDGFEIFTGNELNTQIGRGATSVYRLAARREEDTRVVTIFIISGRGDATEYLTQIREEMQEDREILSDVEALTINGMEFASIASRAIMSSGEQEGQAVDEITLAYTVGEHVVGISNVFLPEDEAEIRAGFEQMLQPITAEN